ncbi:MAG: hypothetical protein KJ057_10530 [Phycisphaerae bacterium]|nr:MAG: hypothetical protein EDS66_13535 [Planctomycetota bacterium]KAB2949721.1 MAG: hypothetical protein F9K17_01955 [Phycisphaerae bacterium]MBE7457519.1 hypothetical protein [Planctomycetia bacterium]MCK6464558.1 hypothetical protein [Phycisphaerae bacterium]MCL4718895.1 hypothetical protein [Phycisphaerae bacterium]
MMLAGLFSQAIPITGAGRILLLLPLCLSIAIVYKTIRCPQPRQIPTAVLPLWITIVVAMYVIGALLWAVFNLLS